MNEFGDAPEFRHLHDHAHRTAIESLRLAVAPILSNNLLRHFTDHSVAHSDHMTGIVDQLIERLQVTDERLDESELMIVYGACYLHDIGMQYEMSSVQRAMHCQKLSPMWRDLEEETRHALLRSCHHEIAAEMIQQSVRAAAPCVGIQLGGVYDPDRLACICEAHCVDVGSDRYGVLTTDGSSVRMALLAALLRIADLLDESRRRAKRERARTLDLDVQSQAHWWRHYYTERIEIDQIERTIRLLFDSPADRRDDYEKVVPFLQKPEIDAELQAQSRVLTKHNLNWVLAHQVLNKAYSSAEAMPDEVFAYMVAMLGYKRASHPSEQERALVERFIDARPFLAERWAGLASEADVLPPDDYLRKAQAIALDMWELGGRRSAWIALESVYHPYRDKVSPAQRIDTGIRLSEMILQDQEPHQALRSLADLEADVNSLQDNNMRYRYWRLRALCSLFSHDLETPAAIDAAMLQAPSGVEREELLSWKAEWSLLQGDLGSVGDIETTGGGDRA